jgi:hypothetical protein
MSDQLFPEDVLNARASLRSMAAFAKAEADVEDEKALLRQRDAEAEILADQALMFMLVTLDLPEAMVEDVAFETASISPGRAVISWTIDGIELRCRPAGTIDSGMAPYFEVWVASGFTKKWALFTSLATLGRLLPGA